jgi:hypothetical protein
MNHRYSNLMKLFLVLEESELCRFDC